MRDRVDCRRCEGNRLNDIVVILREGLSSRTLELHLVLRHQSFIDLDFWRCERRSSDELEGGVADELTSEPQERLLEVVVRLGGYLEVLQVLLPVEGNGAGLDFPLLDIDFVAAQNDGDLLAHALKITMPVRHVLVRDPARHIEHDDSTLALNVVSIPEAAELFLSRRIPDVKADRAEGGRELERVDFYAERRNVFLLELARQVSLDESRLAGTTIADKDKLESWDLSSFGCHVYEIERLGLCVQTVVKGVK